MSNRTKDLWTGIPVSPNSATVIADGPSNFKKAIYPGTFNPWHEGHEDILDKALCVFDHVFIGRGINPAKAFETFNQHGVNFYGREGVIRKYVDIQEKSFTNSMQRVKEKWGSTVCLVVFPGLLADFVKEEGFHAVIRGLRNGADLQYEMNQQYWNEDLGLEAPVIYFITDRKLAHISSSAIRQIELLRTGEKKLKGTAYERT